MAKCGSGHRQTAARLSTLAGVSEHLHPEHGRRRQPEVVRECLGWGAFATVVVPAVLMLTGAEITTAALGAGVVAAVTAAVFVVVRLTRLSLPQLGTSEAADAPSPHELEPPEPAWTPAAVEAQQFYPAPEQAWLPAPVGQTWHEPWNSDWNDEPAWIPDGPWLPPAAPIGPPFEPYPKADHERLHWEGDGAFAEVYQPREPWLPEPRVDQSGPPRAEQRGRHRRGP